MKVFRVIVEVDGEIKKEPGLITQELKRYNYYYIAEDLLDLLESDTFQYIVTDPERTVLGVVEEIPSVDIIKVNERT